MIEKRYQYYSNEGIQWSSWIPYVEDNSMLDSLKANEKWQLKDKLRNEFRIVWCAYMLPLSLYLPVWDGLYLMIMEKTEPNNKSFMAKADIREDLDALAEYHLTMWDNVTDWLMNNNHRYHSPSSLDYPYIGCLDEEDDTFDLIIELKQY